MKTLLKIILFLILGIIGLAVIGNLLSDSNKPNYSQPTTKEKTITTNCDFKSAEIKAFEVGTDKLLANEFIESCFVRKLVDESLGLVEITNNSNSIKVSYYVEDDPNILRFLDIKIGDGEPAQWRANLGHDLFIVEKDDELNFIFGDREKTKIKGSIKLMKN